MSKRRDLTITEIVVIGAFFGALMSSPVLVFLSRLHGS